MFLKMKAHWNILDNIAYSFINGSRGKYEITFITDIIIKWSICVSCHPFLWIGQLYLWVITSARLTSASGKIYSIEHFVINYLIFFEYWINVEIIDENQNILPSPVSEMHIIQVSVFYI